MKEKRLCEFCGKRKICESTTLVGWYCKECHRTLIYHSQEAIKTIKEKEKREKE